MTSGCPRSPGGLILEGANTASSGVIPIHEVKFKAERRRASPPPQKLRAALRCNAVEELPIQPKKTARECKRMNESDPVRVCARGSVTEVARRPIIGTREGSRHPATHPMWVRVIPAPSHR